jgi:ABC-type glycerol-3-phosphate transport system substrate-binding protein
MKKLFVVFIILTITSFSFLKLALSAEQKIIKLNAVGWVQAEWPLKELAAQYEKLHPDIKIVYEDVGIDLKKYQQLVKEGKFEWNAILGGWPASDTAPGFISGMFQPMDTYVKKSREKDAPLILKDMIPSVLAESKFRGRALSSLPITIDIDALLYRKDVLKAVGYEKPPATNWNDVNALAEKVVSAFKSKGIWGISTSIIPFHRGPAAIQQTFTKKPFLPNGLVDVTGDGMIKTMLLLKSWIDKGLSMPDSMWYPFPGDAFAEPYLKGQYAMFVYQHSAGIWAYQTIGKENSGLTRLPKDVAGGTVFWSTPAYLYKDAPHPQEAVDFLIWAFGPSNEFTWKKIFESGKLPPYRTPYVLAKNNPDWAWALDMLAVLEEATPIPNTTNFGAQLGIIRPWAEKYLSGQIKDPLEAMKGAKKELDKQLSKLIFK